MVRIVNWLLTRRCNLKCEYCGIVKVGGIKTINHFKENEITTERVINLLNKFKTYNPNIFHIFYGGEPFLRSDLSDILKFCNDNNIVYTVISNCTPDIRPRIFQVMEECGGFRGFTGSVDPSILVSPSESQSQLKSSSAFYFLNQIKGYVDDVVAEVTMTKKTINFTYSLIGMLTGMGIYSSLTAIDINKNYGYDFSAYSDTCHLIKRNKSTDKLYTDLMNDNTLLIHMKEVIVPQLFQTFERPYYYICGMGTSKPVHNLTIDADGSLRTCLRIRGRSMGSITDMNLFDNDRNLYRFLDDEMMGDRNQFCQGCNHTCVMMSEYEEEVGENRILQH